MAQQYNWGYAHAVAITPSDTVNFNGSVSTSGQDVAPCDGIWVGGAGIVIAILQNGTAVSFTSGIGLLPIRATQEAPWRSQSRLLLVEARFWHAYADRRA